MSTLPLLRLRQRPALVCPGPPPWEDARMVGAVQPSKLPHSEAFFMGVDPSLTETGVAIIHGGLLKSFVMPPDPKLRGGQRLVDLHTKFVSLFKRYRPHGVVIEGYAFGRANQLAQLGELGGILKLALHECGLQYAICAPQALKKFATGKGVSEKSVVSKEIYRRWGIDLDNNNEVDAAVLALIGKSLWERGDDVLTLPQMDVLARGVTRL